MGELVIEIEVAKTELQVHETTRLRIEFQNRGPDAVDIPYPAGGFPGLVLEVENRGSGKKTVTSGSARAARFSPRFQPIAPDLERCALERDGTSGGEIDLLAWTGTLVAGRYRLTAVLESDAGALRSNAIDVVVATSPLVRAELLPPQLASEREWYSVETRGAGGKISEVTVREWSYSDCACAGQTVVVDHIPGDAVPAISRMPNQMWREGVALAWIQGQRLSYRLIDEDGETYRRDTTPLPGGRSSIVALLQGIADDDGRASCDMVLAHSAPAARHLLFLAVPPRGSVRNMHSLPLPTDRELCWATGAKRVDDSHGENVVAWVSCDASATHLSAAEWSSGKRPEQSTVAANWIGRFVAAAASTDDSDALRGVLMIHHPGSRTETTGYRLVTWSISAAGELSSEVRELDWPPTAELHDCQLAIDRGGQVAALFRDGDDHWWTYTEKRGIRELPVALSAVNAVNLFFAVDEVAAVRFADGGGRFRHIHIDGTSYPEW